MEAEDLTEPNPEDRPTTSQCIFDPGSIKEEKNRSLSAV